MNHLIKTINTTALGLIITLSGAAISPVAFAEHDRNWGRDRGHDRSADRDHSTKRDHSAKHDRSTDKSRKRHAQADQHHKSRQPAKHRRTKHRPSSKHRYNYDHRRPSHYRYGHRQYYPRPYYRYQDYPRYHYSSRYPDFFKYLAFAAITWKILDILNDNQQRKHEEAMSRAMHAPVGDSITWDDEEASGSVTTTRSGVNGYGQPCREFQQTVTIGGRSEQAYGTACLQADGSWQIVQ